MTLTLLQQLELLEVSAVDSPANMLPGFMVRKSAKGKEYRLRTDHGLAAVLENISLVAAHEGVPAETVKAAKDEAIACAVRAAYESSAGDAAGSGDSSAERLAKSLFRNRIS